MRSIMDSLPRIRIPHWIAGLGLGFGALTIVEVILHIRQPDPLSQVFVAGVITSFPIFVGLVVGSVWLRDSSLAEARRHRIALWTLLGLLFFLSFILIIAFTVTEGPLTRIATIRWGLALGAGSGFLIGVFEARSIEQAVEAQRIRDEELERRRELLDYLNGILRHEVLNSATVIQGYADLIEAHSEGAAQVDQYTDPIRSEATQLTTVTEDIQRLLETAEGTADLRPMDVVAVIEEELEALRSRYDAVSVDGSLPDEAWVIADELVDRVFANMLENAVEHNDGSPEVGIQMTTHPDRVTVEIADNGQGIPDSDRGHLFEQSTRSDTTHGIGLSIVKMLVQRYDGEVELVETGPDGSIFQVELPRATEMG